METAQALGDALNRLLAAGRVEVREGGAWLASLEGFRYEAREQKGAVLLHLWSEDCNLVRRVVRVVSEDAERLTLEVARFGRARPERLEFVSAERRRPAGRITREQFRAKFRELLARRFPDETVDSLVTSPDLEHSLSGNYARGVLRGVARSWAVLAAAPGENPPTHDALLTFGLLWLDRARDARKRQPVSGLRLFFPEGAGAVTAHRLQAIANSRPIELYEYHPGSLHARPMEAQDLGNVESWLAPRRDFERILLQAAPEIESVRRLSPKAIEAEPIPASSEVVLRFRGLAFARWRDGQMSCGVASTPFEDAMQPVAAGQQSEWKQLVKDLETHRSPVGDGKHPWYRAQPERWLQSLVAEDVTRVDARLDPRFVYAQVPAVSSSHRGVMDLLCVTRTGRLAVLELKAGEDLHLVLQAVDYWLRVRSHLRQGDFSRHGYFPGISLDPRPPLLFLVAPSLQFHPANDALLRHVSKEIEICRIGIAENWRRGLKVVLRQRGK